MLSIHAVTDDELDKLITRLAAMDRRELKALLDSLKTRFPLDFTDEFLDEVPTQRGGTWQVSTVRRIVSNRFYTGQREIDGETVAGKYEPIISCELFGRATAATSSTSRHSS